MHFGFIVQFHSYMVLCVFGIANCSIKVTPLDLKANYRLLGHRIGNLTTTNHQLCARFCYSFANCKSIDFFKDEETCNIHDANSSSVGNNELVHASGYVFSNIDTWPVELSGSCGQRPCEDRQCLSTGSLHVCLDIDCKDPGIDKAIYNDSSTVYKTVLHVSCEDGYALDGESTIKCHADGTWSALPACLPEVCLECYRRFDDTLFSGFSQYPFVSLGTIAPVTSCIRKCNEQTPSFKMVGYYEENYNCFCFDFSYSSYVNDGHTVETFEGFMNYELV